MEPDGRTTVYVFSYPKCGGTWLARLLGDVLDSPVGAAYPSQSHLCIAAEGQDRQGGYYIRHGHSEPAQSKGGGKVIPRMGVFCWREVTREKVIFMQRDPRDVLVSVAHHWGLSQRRALDCMAHGNMARPPRLEGEMPTITAAMRSWSKGLRTRASPKLPPL